MKEQKLTINQQMKRDMRSATDQMFDSLFQTNPLYKTENYIDFELTMIMLLEDLRQYADEKIAELGTAKD